MNVSRGSYSIAKDAFNYIEETRSLLAEMVHAKSPSNVVFTSSATIAANEIILGSLWDAYKTVYVSPFEHNAIARPLNRVCGQFGIEMRVLPFDPCSQEWDMVETKRLFELDPPDYVFLNHISNVTGAVVPVESIAKMAKSFGAIVIVDASQSLGLKNIDIQKCNIDYLIFAGHKNLYASWGVGGFIANNKTITPVICGGTGSDSLNLSMSNRFPIGFEAGSPNIIAIASLNASIKWLNSIGLPIIEKRKNSLMNKLISGLLQNDAILYLPKDLRNHSSVLSFNIRGCAPDEAGKLLNEDYGIAVRTGFHCAPFVHKLLGTDALGGTVRASISYFNTEEDIEALICAIKEIGDAYHE